VALRQLQRQVGTANLLYIYYHDGDAYSCSDGNSRMSYYSLNGDPTIVADGTLKQVGSYVNVHQDSVAFAGFYNTRRAITSPCSITVTGTYNPNIRSGQVNVTVTNTSGSTITNHKLRYAILETIPHSWPPSDSCYETLRKMLPSYVGVTITLNAGQTVADSQSFTMSSGWVYAKTRIGVFVQNDANKQILQGGSALLSSFALGVEAEVPPGTVASDLILSQNRPNPYRGSSEIEYSLPKSGGVRLAVYDPQGRLVRTLAEGTFAAGTHRITVSGLKSGVYFYRLEAGNASLTRRMVVAK